jgi:hypothetical protein
LPKRLKKPKWQKGPRRWDFNLRLKRSSKLQERLHGWRWN